MGPHATIHENGRAMTMHMSNNATTDIGSTRHNLIHVDTSISWVMMDTTTGLIAISNGPECTGISCHLRSHCKFLLSHLILSLPLCRLNIYIYIILYYVTSTNIYDSDLDFTPCQFQCLWLTLAAFSLSHHDFGKTESPELTSGLEVLCDLWYMVKALKAVQVTSSNDYLFICPFSLFIPSLCLSFLD